MILLTITVILVLMIYQYFKKRSSTYDIFIEENTVFFFKTKPDVICTIYHIDWNYFLNPKVELNVIYPSGSKTKLITTMAEFNNLWEIK